MQTQPGSSLPRPAAPRGPLTRGRFALALGAYLAAAALVLAWAPFVGTVEIAPASIWASLHGGAWDTVAEIFWQQRVPRVLLGFCAGGTLALVGAAFQVILRNPLADPYTLGITGGGALGATLVFLVPGLARQWGPLDSVPLGALAGAVAVTALIYTLARRRGGLVQSNTLLLAGVTVGIFCGALILAVRYFLSPNLLVLMDRWLMGGLGVVGYRELAGLPPLLLPGLGLLLMQMPALNQLALGEDIAAGYGVQVGRVQTLCFLGGSLATAAVVALVGPIGFVGLLAPHIVRRLSGVDQRIVLPASFLAGGAFLAACDALARILLPRLGVSSMELPVGVLTALVGGPFFIWLLLRRTHS